MAVCLDREKSFMPMKHRVLTTYPELSDPNYKQYVEYLDQLGLQGHDWDNQQIGDDWNRDDYCWYFSTGEMALLFKMYSGGRML